MPEQKKIERKLFFIDRKLQGKYMMTFLVPMLVMLVFMVVTLYFAANSLVQTASTIVKQDIQNKITVSFLDKSDPSIESYKQLLNGINVYLLNFSENERYKTAVISSLLWVFGIGILLIIIQIVLMTIFFSHKLAGPIYRFEILCHGIINGVYTDMVHLRKGDEMRNLANLLNEVIERTRKRFLDIKNAKSEEERQRVFDSIKI